MGEHYGKVTMRESCLQDIANAPTVDAIPVEFLQDEAGRYEYEGRTYSADIILSAIENWEKEQEEI